jgi:hypothetical protein
MKPTSTQALRRSSSPTRAIPGPFVDTEGAAEILGVSLQYVSWLAAQGLVPWLPKGRLAGGPTRVYRRARTEVIARAAVMRGKVHPPAGSRKPDLGGADA